jgi:hypothetical protein
MVASGISGVKSLASVIRELVCTIQCRNNSSVRLWEIWCSEGECIKHNYSIC